MSTGIGRLAALVALAAAIALAYAPALAGMKAMWDATPMYSFGYIVPFVSAYLVWTRRDALAAITPRPERAAGAAVFGIAAVLLVVGRLASLQILEQFSFVVALVAAVLLVWGWATLRTIWMAVAYLLLIVPFWDALTEPLHAPFQRQSAHIGVALLQILDIPVYQEGNFIYLPTVRLEVARACSGVNYLVAVLALGVPLAYLSLPTMSRRILLVGSAVAVAALSNGLRVALIGTLAYADVGSPLHGPAHMLHGLFVSGVGYVVLLGGLRLLAPAGGAPRAQAPTAASPPESAPDRASIRRGIDVPVRRVLATAGLFAGLWGALALYRPVPVPLLRPLVTLPAVLGAWQAVPSGLADATWWRDADDSVHRIYVGPGGERLEVAIGYFAAQTQGREAASHLSGPLHRAITATVALPDGGGGPVVNQVSLAAPGGRRTGVFWYDVGGTIATSQLRAKLATARSVLASRRSAALIVVVLDAGVPGHDSPAPARPPAVDLAVELRRALAGITGSPEPES